MASQSFHKPSYVVQRLFAKNNFYWRSFGMIFDELSKASLSFVLRRLGADLDWGGGLDAPHPRSTPEVSEHQPGAG